MEPVAAPSGTDSGKLMTLPLGKVIPGVADVTVAVVALRLVVPLLLMVTVK